MSQVVAARGVGSVGSHSRSHSQAQSSNLEVLRKDAIFIKKALEAVRDRRACGMHGDLSLLMAYSLYKYVNCALLLHVLSGLALLVDGTEKVPAAAPDELLRQLAVLNEAVATPIE